MTSDEQIGHTFTEMMTDDLNEAIRNGLTLPVLMCCFGAVMEAVFIKIPKEHRDPAWDFFVHNMQRKLEAMP